MRGLVLSMNVAGSLAETGAVANRASRSLSREPIAH
jgi:hypothetical protein